MDLSFGNPLGAWALAGVPVILAIHFLQRQARSVVTSTLFLLEQIGPVNAQGRRLERLRNSLPLWLQLLAVLLVTWLLVQPRWLRADSAQTIVLVLDSSVSMQAFRAELDAALPPQIERLKNAAARTEWIVLESDPARPTVYSGPNDRDALAAINAWQPRLGSHDAGPALRAARALPRENGAVIFVTDHVTAIPEGVDLVAVGKPMTNVGFSGLATDGPEWTALVRNPSDEPQNPTWFVETLGGITTDPVALTIAPGQTQVLRGRLPDGVDRITLRLSEDEFPLDDQLPIQRPEPKRLRLAVQAGTPFDAFFKRLVDSLPSVEPAEESEAAVRLLAYNPLAPGAANGDAVVLVSDPAPSARYRTGDIFAEEEPLTTDLSWQSLIVRETLGMPRRDGDRVLLWQGEHPLIFLRPAADDVTGPGGKRGTALVVNFDLRQSNAERLPAFVILLHRFLEGVRSNEVAPESKNVETNQRLDVALRADGGVPVINGESENRSISPNSILRAPAEPGFFTVSQGDVSLVNGAAFFADAREADFRAAASTDTLAAKQRELVERNSRQDLLTPVWALALLGVCVASWAAVGRKERAA